MRALEEHAWPGNVRELRNVVERAVYRWDDRDTPIAHIVFDPFESPWKPASGPVAANENRSRAAVSAAGSSGFDRIADLRGAVDAHERGILEHALGKHRYNQRQTAKGLGLTYDQLRHCLKKHGLLERGSA